jgi:ribosomal protein S18 acetylase RimI-like enzyme
MSKSSNTFNDPLIKMEVSKSNFTDWEKKFKYTNSVPNHFLSYMGISVDKKEKVDVKKKLYLERVKMFVNNNSGHLLNKLMSVNKSRTLLEEDKEEYNELMRVYNKSIKEYYDAHNKKIVIRLVLKTNKDKLMAYVQYYYYKIRTQDTYTPKSIVSEVDDFILKNQIYGLYADNLMIGFLIIKKSRAFIIDDNSKSNTDTFYIQEVYIDKSMRGKKLGKILLDYALLICPIGKKYISLMTYEGNPMANIAKSYNFVLQKKPSPCPVNKLLFIRKMREDDFVRNTNRISDK